MKSLTVCLVLFLVCQHSFSQESAQGWIVYGVYSSLSGIPVSYSNTWPPTSPVELSSSTVLIGLGYRFHPFESRWYFDLRGDYSSGTFSDWRVKDREIQYYMFGVDVGYILADGGPFSRFSLFGSLGGGGFVQSYGEKSTINGNSSTFYEYYGEVEYPVYAGLGIRVAVTRRILIRGESRFYFISEGGGDPIGVSFYSEPKKYRIGGNVSGIGLEVVF